MYFPAQYRSRCPVQVHCRTAILKWIILHALTPPFQESASSAFLLLLIPGDCGRCLVQDLPVTVRKTIKSFFPT